MAYNNNEHVNTKGDCCEIGQSVCRLDCKNVFNICLDDPNDRDGNSCSYGNYVSEVIADDKIEFMMNVYDEKLSRLIFPFQQWKVCRRIRLITLKNERKS